MAEFTLQDKLTETPVLTAVREVIAESFGIPHENVSCSLIDQRFTSDENICHLEIKGTRNLDQPQKDFQERCAEKFSQLLGIELDDLECKLEQGPKPSSQTIYLRVQFHDVQIADNDLFKR